MEFNNEESDELIKNDVCNLTLIANDTCIPQADRGKLIVNKRSIL